MGLLGWIAYAASSLALVILGHALLRSWKSAALLALALATIMALAWLLGAALLSVLRRASGISAISRRPLLRYAIDMLHRPGNRSGLLIMVLATVFAVLIATFEAGTAVVRGIFNVLPYDRNSLYLAGFRDEDVRDFFHRLEGVRSVDIMTQARLELRMVRNPPIESFAISSKNDFHPPPQNLDRSAVHRVVGRLDPYCDAGYSLDAIGGRDSCVSTAAVARVTPEPDPSGVDIRSLLLAASGGSNALTATQWNYYYWRITKTAQLQPMFINDYRLQTMTVDFYLEQRANSGIDNRSYTAVCEPGSPHTIVDEEAARPHGARIGSVLVLASRDRVLEKTVTGIRKFTPAERFWSTLELDCSGLSPDSLYHRAQVQIAPDQFAAAEKAIRAEFPALPVITPEDIALTIRFVGEDAIRLVRVTAWYAIAAGLCVLIALVAASRSTRLREIGILSALGARRRTMLKIYSIEFAALGVLSGLVGSLLTVGFASVLLSVIFQRPQLVFDWNAIGIGLLTAAALTTAAGWLPAYSLLREKPMNVLRRE